MGNVRNGGLSLRCQSRHAQRRAATQIRTPHGGSVEPLHAQHHRRPTGNPDVRPHSGQLIHMAVAAAEQVFLEYRRPPAPQQRRHQNGLRVGGKAGIGGRADGPGRRQSSGTAAHDPGAAAGHVAPRLPEHRRHSGEVLLPCVPEKDLAPGGGRPAQVSGRRDAVRQNGVSTAVERPSAPDHHRGCARAGDLRTAGIQKALQVFNFRFSGGVGKHRDALRAAGRQHQIFRGPHRGEPQHDLPPRQLCRLAVQGAAGIVDLRPKCPEAGEVQVDGPGT